MFDGPTSTIPGSASTKTQRHLRHVLPGKNNLKSACNMTSKQEQNSSKKKHISKSNHKNRNESQKKKKIYIVLHEKKKERAAAQTSPGPCPTQPVQNSVAEVDWSSWEDEVSTEWPVLGHLLLVTWAVGVRKASKMAFDAVLASHCF